MERREVVVHMINQLNDTINSKEMTPKEEETEVVRILREYRKSGVSKHEVVDALSDVFFKYHSTFIALWNVTLE